MAQNSKPRSVSSASNKRKYHPERSHVRSSRQVHPTTPRVLSPSPNSDSPAGGRNYGNRTSSRTSGHASGSRNQGSRTGSQRANTRGASSRRAQGNHRSSSGHSRNAVKKKHGIGFKFGIVLTIIVLFIGGFIALYFSPVLPITEVAVAGNEKLKSEYVVELAEVPADSTFLRTNTENIKARLLAEPWIQDASIERSFPGTLTLRITEQPVAAVVDILPETASDSTKRWIIAEDGTWISQVSDGTTGSSESAGATAADSGTGEGAEGSGEGATGSAENGAEGATDSAVEDAAEGASGGAAEGGNADGSAGSDGSADGSDSTEGTAGANSAASAQPVEINAEELVNIPKIKDVSAAVRPESGVKETDEGITNALALLKGFSPEMRAMVASISAPDAVKTTLTLYNNVGVAFGAAVDIEAKEQAIATLLAEHEGTITLINVRVADRATYRATD